MGNSKVFEIGFATRWIFIIKKLLCQTKGFRCPLNCESFDGLRGSQVGDSCLNSRKGGFLENFSFDNFDGVNLMEREVQDRSTSTDISFDFAFEYLSPLSLCL